MTIHALRDQPSPHLAAALAGFEAEFTYPLGVGKTFRISHGEDYPRFFRSMGDSRCFIAEANDKIIGSLSVTIRTLTLSNRKQLQAAYIGDLKIAPKSRSSLTFLRLAQAGLSWAQPQVSAAFGIVMDGTPTSPQAYTARLGIPKFFELGKIFILQFASDIDASDCRVSTREGSFNFAHTCPAIRSNGGDSRERSEIEPFWLVYPDGLAAGKLEDTRRAKRLIDSEGAEMRSAHLVDFSWQTPEAARHLLDSARHHAARLGFSSLFVAISQKEMEVLSSAISFMEKLIAPATIFGVGLPTHENWSINSSEI